MPQHNLAAEPGRIIFSSVSSGKWDLWSIKPDGTGLKQITNSLEDEHTPAVSADGKTIACIVDRVVWTMRVDRTERQKLPLPAGIYASPAWTPDGLGIVYVKLTVVPSEASEIWIVKKTGNHWGEPQRITRHPPMRLNPSFSPGGSKLAHAKFERDRLLGVVEEIGVLDLKENKFVEITADGADSFKPMWSPSGDKIAYMSNKSGNYDIWTVHVKTRKQHRLTTDPAYDGDPAWSTDGSQIAFVSSRSGAREIWIMSTDGKKPRQVTKMGTSCEGPSWAK
ncbi:hypothetical protein ACFL9U_12335 [Thermodesulfobacteriota bacterium]